MKKSLIFVILCEAMATYCVYADLSGKVENGLTAAAVFAIAAALLWLKSRKDGTKKSGKSSPKTKTAKPTTAMPTPAAAAAPVIQTQTYKTVYEGKVKGVTKQGRQKVLEKLLEMESEGETIFYSLEEDEYEGRPSIKVMASTMDFDKPPKQIGFIAEVDVEKVLPYVDTAFVDGTIYGGEDGKYYGAAVEVSVQD